MDPDIANLATTLITQFLGSAAGAAGSAAIKRGRKRDGTINLGSETLAMLERCFQAWLESQNDRIHLETGDIYIIVEQGVGAVVSGDVTMSFVEQRSVSHHEDIDIASVVDVRRKRIQAANEQRGGFE